MKNIHLHRFGADVAISLPGNGETCYMSASEARQVACALVDCARDIAARPFVSSTFNNRGITLANGGARPATPKPLQVTATLTDTFGGEANYAWTRRASFVMPAGASDLAIVRRAKKELQHDCRTRTERDGTDGFVLRSIGECTIAFIEVTA